MWPAYRVVTCMHCKSFLETWLTFELPSSFIPLLFSVVICVCLSVVQGKEDSGKCKENLLVIQVSVLYSKTLIRQESVICSYLLQLVWHHSHFQTAQKNSSHASFFLHSLKIRMTSHPCNKYTQITLSYLLTVNQQMDLWRRKQGSSVGNM